MGKKKKKRCFNLVGGVLFWGFYLRLCVLNVLVGRLKSCFVCFCDVRCLVNEFITGDIIRLVIRLSLVLSKFYGCQFGYIFSFLVLNYIRFRLTQFGAYFLNLVIFMF